MSKVLICESCKSYWMQTAGMFYCGDCGSGRLVKTHDANFKHAKNYKPQIDQTTLTKREAFALAAMQGNLAACHDCDVTDFQEIAHDCVMIADALLKELEK